MKFYCDSCNAKYSIADEKVRGKVVKVRCKQCGEIIEVSDEMRRVREAAAEQRTGTDRTDRGSARSSPTPDVEEPQWYYSVQGETLGPLPETELRRKYENGEVGEGSYVWRDGFGDWESAAEVEPFASALESEPEQETSAGRNRTMGVGESIEAVEQPDDDDDEGLGVTGRSPDSGQRRSSESRSRGDRASGGDSGGDRKERLQQLRDKLKSDFAPGEDTGVEERPEDSGLTGGAEQADSPGLERGDASGGASRGEGASSPGGLSDAGPGGDRGGPAGEPSIDGGDATAQMDHEELKAGAAAEAEPDEPESSEEIVADSGGEPEALDEFDEFVEGAGEEAEDDFSLPPSGSDRIDEETESAEPAGAGDAAAGQAAGVAAESAEPEVEADDVDEHDGLFDDVDEDSETAIPTAPKLSGEAEDETSGGFGEGITESLMIQLDQIQEEGKKERWGKIGAALVLLTAAGFAWYNVYDNDDDSPLPDALRSSESEYYVPDDDGPAVEKTYSDEERREIFSVKPQVVESPSSEGEKSDDEGAGSEGTGSNRQQGSARSDQNESSDDEESLLEGSTEIAESDGPSMDEAFESAQARKGEDEEGPSIDGSEQAAVASGSESSAGIDNSDDGFAPGLQAMAETSGSGGSKIEHRSDPAVEEEEDEGTKLPKELSKEQIKKGIASVRESVGTCRQRHARRGAPLEVRKIYMTLKVDPSGSVSSYEVEPEKVDNTAFERCMASHRGRWRFGSFKGKSQKVRAPFVLQ